MALFGSGMMHDGKVGGGVFFSFFFLIIFLGKFILFYISLERVANV